MPLGSEAIHSVAENPDKPAEEITWAGQLPMAAPFIPRERYRWNKGPASVDDNGQYSGGHGLLRMTGWRNTELSPKYMRVITFPNKMVTM